MSDIDRILVTGATGFLGSNLIRKLIAEGKEVTAFLRKGSSHPFLNGKRLKFFYGDILDYSSLLRCMQDCDFVFHTAGYLSYCRIHKKQMYSVNVSGTENVCKAALEAGIKKMVHVSSTSAVGIPDNPDQPANEDLQFQKKWNRIPYMYTKHLAEKKAIEYYNKGLSVVIVNPSTFYGQGDVKLHTGQLFKNIITGTLKIAPPGGNGVIAISDCVDGLIAAMDKGEAGRRYILNSENLTFLEIFNTIAETVKSPPITKTFPKWAKMPFSIVAFIIENSNRIIGKPSPIDLDTIKISWQYRYFDSSRAGNELKWEPKVSFKDTCTDAFKFYKSNDLLI